MAHSNRFSHDVIRIFLAATLLVGCTPWDGYAAPTFVEPPATTEDEVGTSAPSTVAATPARTSPANPPVRTPTEHAHVNQNLSRAVISVQRFDLSELGSQSPMTFPDNLSLLVADVDGRVIALRGSERAEVSPGQLDAPPNSVRYMKVAPDGGALALATIGPTPDELTLTVVQISDGSSRQIALDNTASHFDWINQSVLVVGTLSDSTSGEIVLKWLVDVSTGVVHNLPPIVAKDGVYAWEQAGTRGIALRPDLEGVDIWAESTDSTHSGLPWISTLPYYGPGAVRLVWTHEGFFVVDMDTTRVMISGPQTDERLLSKPNSTLTLVFPDKALGGSLLLWVDESLGQIGMLRSVASTLQSGPLFASDIYLISAQTGRATVFRLPTGASIGQVVVDDSGRYWAWRSQDGIATKAVVLDTHTGEFAEYPNCTVVAGWASRP